ncbi:MAG TPA: HAMP domain-containing sensor histidine kinase [Patescibacteria group bacterium]|nr:HAMP domain-containing sensor histidine kinase [Patescibacteria group bacterium]
MLKINTLRSKFLLSFVLISLAYIAISSFFILNMINSTNNRMNKINFVRWAKDFETMVEPNFIYFNYMNLTSQAEEILKENRKDFIMLFDSQNKEIIYRGPDWIKAELAPYKSETDDHVREAVFDSQSYYLISLPVKVAAADTVWGRILFGRSNEENRGMISELRFFIIIISALLLTVFIILIVVINRKLTQPIQLLKNGLEKISYGSFSHRIQIHSNDEFSYLGSQFNEMAEKIENMMTEIEATHKELEKQVTSRTRELNESHKKLQIAMQELRDTQRHIIQSEKQKSLTAIVSGFAHEINNPLTGILGYVDLISIREDSSPYVKEKLGSIQKQAVRIKNIIDQLNQLNPDMDQVKMEISLSNLLEKLIKVISSRPENSDYTIVKNNFNEDITIHGNHFSLWQVFEGIVENALEAFRENNIRKGKIAIELKKSMDGGQAIVDVSDNGGGFKNLDKAFDPFYTTKNRTQKKGIGLTLAYNIIQEHLGNIVIKNNETNGATVSVYLKIAEKKFKNQNQAEEK